MQHNINMNCRLTYRLLPNPVLVFARHEIGVFRFQLLAIVLVYCKTRALQKLLVNISDFESVVTLYIFGLA